MDALICLNGHSTKLMYLIVPADTSQSLPSSQYISVGGWFSSCQCPALLLTALFRELSFLVCFGVFWCVMFCRCVGVCGSLGFFCVCVWFCFFLKCWCLLGSTTPLCHQTACVLIILVLPYGESIPSSHLKYHLLVRWDFCREEEELFLFGVFFTSR